MYSQIQTVLPIQNVMLGDCEHLVKVRRIGDGWNCRVFANGVLNQEARVFDRAHIGLACQDMLRFEDKCGNISQYANSSRNRK